MALPTVIYGTDVKFKIEIDAEGFDISTDNFSIELSVNDLPIHTFPKSELVTNDEGEYFLCLETKDYSIGQYDIKITVDIPDLDFADQIRTEIYRTHLMYVKSK